MWYVPAAPVLYAATHTRRLSAYAATYLMPTGPLREELKLRLLGQPLPLIQEPLAVCPAATLLSAGRLVERELRHAGVRPGDPVGVQLPNGIQFVVALLACVRAEAVCVPALEQPLAAKVRLLPHSGVMPRLVTVENAPDYPLELTAHPAAAVWLRDERPDLWFTTTELLHTALAAAASQALQPGHQVTGRRPWTRQAGLIEDCLAGLLAGCEILC